MDDTTVGRREFTRISLMSMLAGVTVTISGCGGGGGGSNSPNNPTPPAAGGDKVATISSNHGHVARITAAQMNAGGSAILTLGGAVGVPDHTHSVELTAAEVIAVRDGARVSKTSTTGDLHEHLVTFN